MKKVELIEAKQYLTETEKAVNLLHEEIDRIRTSANPKDKLDILKELLPKVDDYEQFEKLSKEKAALEFKIKHAHEKQTFIPEEHREKILNNRDIELVSIDEKLSEQYTLLNTYIEELEKTVLPLLMNIYRLESRKDLSFRLDEYADATYSYTDFGHIMRFEPLFGFRKTGIKSVPARAHYEKFVEVIDLLKGKRQVGILKGKR